MQTKLGHLCKFFDIFLKDKQLESYLYTPPIQIYQSEF